MKPIVVNKRPRAADQRPLEERLIQACVPHFDPLLRVLLRQWSSCQDHTKQSCHEENCVSKRNARRAKPRSKLMRLMISAEEGILQQLRTESVELRKCVRPQAMLCDCRAVIEKHRQYLRHQYLWPVWVCCQSETSRRRQCRS